MARKDVRGRGAPEREEPSGFRRFIRRMFVWAVSLAVVGLLVLGVAVGLTVRSLPEFDELKGSQVGQTILVRARDGTELVSIGPSYGHWLSHEQIPQVMRTAMVSVEDRRFHSHPGIDPIGLVRAGVVSIATGKSVRATSTITQQLARTVFLNNNRSYTRKLREAVLALALEWKFSKAQILELYLNKVYFGGGAYGVDAASRKFFGHPGTEITLPEAAIIAGLVKAPSHYSPTADSQAAVDRAKVVLSVMQDNGDVTPSQAAAVDFNAIRFAAEKGQNSVRYFTDWALPQLDLLLPDNTQAIEVWTTLDPKMQAAATQAIEINTPKSAQGALVSMDRDGAVLAMVGGTDYVSSNYNRAVNAVRQPGSAWKLFVYLAALEAGYTPNDRVVDEPVTIDGWSPRNSNGTYAGEIDVRTAFAYSKNTVAAQLGNEVGFSAVAGIARRFGITTPISTVPSMVLGTNDVRLIDMTRAFAAVSAKGRAVEPYGIVKVQTLDGKVLYQREVKEGPMLVPAYVSAGITDLLQSAVSTGTGRAAQIGRPVAGKTGTTNSNKDGWFLGFSSGITTGVWMGRDDAKAVPGLQGGTAPARAFAGYMTTAVASRPIEKFDTEVTLPAWQLEPDDEAQLGGNPDEYYYADDQGNMVEPDRQEPAPASGPEAKAPPPAANDDFLREAIGARPVANAKPTANPTNRKPPSN